MATLGSIIVTIILWILQFIGWSLLCLLFAAWWGQSYILYLPTFDGRSGIRRKLSFNHYTSRSPAEQNITYHEFFLTTSDNVLIHTWLLPCQNSNSNGGKSNINQQPPRQTNTLPTIILFHGNAGNIGNRIFNAQQLIYSCQVNVFLVEYRGYGNSTGAPSEHGFHLDALCALDFLRSRNDIDSSKIFLLGSSLGGAVAIWLAAQRPQHIAGLMVENTFTSIEDMAVTMFTNMAPTNWSENATFMKCLRSFLYLFMTSHWRSIDLVPHLQRPTLLLSGLADELIPPQQMQTIFKALPSNLYRHMHCVEDGGHNDTHLRGNDDYYGAIARFIDTVIKAPQFNPPSGSVVTQ